LSRNIENVFADYDLGIQLDIHDLLCVFGIEETPLEITLWVYYWGFDYTFY
jgi:hypothetical protein